jgi:hypothetical protein
VARRAWGFPQLLVEPFSAATIHDEKISQNISLRNGTVLDSKKI